MGPDREEALGRLPSPPKMTERAASSSCSSLGRAGAEIAVTQAFATLSEVLGHLDMLVERGQAVEDRNDPMITFETK